MQALPNGGMVVSCGTGIEGCDASVIKEVPLSECLADPRRTWRSYVIALDSIGEMFVECVWDFVVQHVDSASNECL